MEPYHWVVVKDCRRVGYVLAYSEYEAMIKAKDKYGDRLFVERTSLPVYDNKPQTIDTQAFRW